ncbi:hypothetical protein KI387_028245, partial [Taxus chinensis]
GTVIVTLIVISGRDCGMERTRFWNGVGGTDTMVGYVAIGICESMGVDGVMVWVVNEGTTDITGLTDTVDVVVIVGMGPSCETTGGKTDE